MTAAFYANNAVWQVYFETHGPLAEVTLTYCRALPDGTGVKFDEDPQSILKGPLDLAADADERLVMDGFLALIPEGELLSCVMRTTKYALVIFWDYMIYEHIFAEYDKQIVESCFNGRLFNTDGNSPDVLFVGGNRKAHDTTTVKHWAKVVQHNGLPWFHAEQLPAWEQMLSIYTAIVYTNSTEIHMLTRNEHDVLGGARAALNEVAARYGLVLPPTSSRTLGAQE